MAGLIRTFLTDRQKLHRLAVHPDPLGDILHRRALKRQSNRSSVLCICHKYISKITIFSEPVKNLTLSKYNFVNLFNVKNDYKRY